MDLVPVAEEAVRLVGTSAERKAIDLRPARRVTSPEPVWVCDYQDHRRVGRRQDSRREHGGVGTTFVVERRSSKRVAAPRSAHVLDQLR